MCFNNFLYKVIHCLETQTYSFFILNNHPSEWKCDKVKLSEQKGMTPKVKRLVEHLYYECEISRPKLIEKKIHNKYKKKIEKDINETIPSLDKYKAFFTQRSKLNIVDMLKVFKNVILVFKINKL